MEPATGESVADTLLQQVLASFERTEDPRLRELICAAVRHLHAFAREVRLSSEERRAAVTFLTAVGQMCSDTRQEVELLSDVMGVSSLVETSSSGAGATLQTLTGPFYSPGAPERAMGASINEWPLSTDVTATIRGVVKNRAGQPISDALIDVWQNATNRQYAVQQPDVQPAGNLRGRFRTGREGCYEFITVKPVSYSIPDDGPVGQLLRSTGRHSWRAAHIHFLVTASGYRPLVTEIFDADSDYLEDDAVFGVARDLVVPFRPQADGTVAARFDIVLEEIDSSPDVR